MSEGIAITPYAEQLLSELFVPQERQPELAQPETPYHAYKSVPFVSTVGLSIEDLQGFAFRLNALYTRTLESIQHRRDLLHEVESGMKEIPPLTPPD